MRRVIQHEWLLGLAGAFAIVYGVLLAVFPVAGAVWLVFLIGAYALFFGVLMIGLGFRLRKWMRDVIPMQPHAA